MRLPGRKRERVGERKRENARSAEEDEDAGGGGDEKGRRGKVKETAGKAKE